MRLLRQTARGHRPARFPIRLGKRLRLLPSLAVLAVMLGTTAGFVVFARENLSHNEHTLLQARLTDTAQIVESLSHDITLGLRDASHIAGLVHGDPAAFRRLAAPDVERTPISSLSLLRLGGLHGTVLASVGPHPPLLTRQFTSFDWASTRHVVPGPTPFKIGLVSGSLVVSYVVAAAGLPDYAVYGELFMKDIVRGAFATERAAEGALYYGTLPVSAALIATNARRLPLRGLQLSKVVTLAPGGQGLLVIHPTRPLVTGLAAQAPWIVLVSGLLLSLGLTALIEVIRRRHDRALMLIDDLSRAHGDLALSERRFRELFEQATDAVFTLDADGVLTAVNQVGSEAFGRPRAELVGLPLADLFAEPDSRGLEEQRLLVSARTLHEVRLQTEVRRADGSRIALDLRIRPIVADGKVVGFQGIGRDVTERLAFEEQLTYQAFHDPLTGLANRALLVDRIEQALARARRGSQVGLVLIDLDDFKTVNDSLGHQAGDGLLQAAAERIFSASPAGSTCARLGGDEFAILLDPLRSVEQATEVASAAVDALEQPFDLAGREAFVRASIGIAVAGEGDEEMALLRNADIAMYQAKGRGAGTRWEVFSPTMLDAAKERLTLGADLKQALGRDEFELAYQPIVDCREGRLVSVEALLRWRHPERGLLLPAAFIGLSEETGLIVEIGELVLETACSQVAVWQQTIPGLGISVNVSGRQLHEQGFAAETLATIARAGLRPEQVTLEITESVLLHDAPGGRVLADLRDGGVRIAVDDFGSGYSSLDYLRRFPVDVLKIDRRFVTTEGGADDVNLLRSIVRLAESLRLETVAEGVETLEQQLVVQRVESSLAQGFFFSKPLAAAGLEQMLQSAWPGANDVLLPPPEEVEGDAAAGFGPRHLSTVVTAPAADADA